MVEQDWQCLGSPRVQVRSPARHSGLRIRHCLSFNLGHDCISNLIPSLGTPYAVGQPKLGGGEELVLILDVNVFLLCEMLSQVNGSCAPTV